nr:FUSC family protein [uncultured Erwinia sp.]
MSFRLIKMPVRTLPRILQITLAILSVQWLAFYFDIEGASTAVMSAIVVTQTFVGGLYHKAAHRIGGTVLGLSVGMVFIVLFPESPRIWLALTLLWLGSMTFIASIVHSDRAYLFLLAGYTFAFVGFPVLVNPDRAWEIYHYRATNVLFGVVVMLFISVVIFPLYQKRHTAWPLARLYRSLLHFNASLRHGRRLDAERLRSFLAGLALPVVHRQTLRHEHQLSRRETRVLDSYLFTAIRLFFLTCLLGKCPSVEGPFFSRLYADFQQQQEQLLLYKKYRLHPPAGFRFCRFRFHQHSDVYLALRRAVRTVATTLLLLFIWYQSGWAGGQVMMTFAVIYIVLLSSARQPEKIGAEALNGTLQGIMLAWVWLQYVYSSVALTRYPDLYFPAQLPVIVYGAQMLAREPRMLRGITLLTTFYFVAPPLNPQQFDYSEFITNATGCFAGMLGFVMGINLILPEPRSGRIAGLIFHSLRELRQTLSHPTQCPADKLILLYDRWMRFSGAAGRSDGLLAFLTRLGSLQLLAGQWQQSYPQTWLASSGPLRGQIDRWLSTKSCLFTAGDEASWSQCLTGLEENGDPAWPVLSLARQLCRELSQAWQVLSTEELR